MTKDLKTVIKEKLASGDLTARSFGEAPAFPETDPGVDPVGISCWIGSC